MLALYNSSILYPSNHPQPIRIVEQVPQESFFQTIDRELAKTDDVFLSRTQYKQTKLHIAAKPLRALARTIYLMAVFPAVPILGAAWHGTHTIVHVFSCITFNKEQRLLAWGKFKKYGMCMCVDTVAAAIGAIAAIFNIAILSTLKKTIIETRSLSGHVVYSNLKKAPGEILKFILLNPWVFFGSILLGVGGTYLVAKELPERILSKTRVSNQRVLWELTTIVAKEHLGLMNASGGCLGISKDDGAELAKLIKGMQILYAKKLSEFLRSKNIKMIDQKYYAKPWQALELVDEKATLKELKNLQGRFFILNGLQNSLNLEITSHQGSEVARHYYARPSFSQDIDFTDKTDFREIIEKGFLEAPTSPTDVWTTEFKKLQEQYLEISKDMQLKDTNTKEVLRLRIVMGYRQAYPWQILGIPQNADSTDTKAAYRKLSLIYHQTYAEGEEAKHLFLVITKAKNQMISESQ